jgi:hypothetical protein
MIESILVEYVSQIKHIEMLLLIINAVVHLFFAGAVAKDAGMMYQIGRKPALVSAHVWAFATLVGGVTVAAIYWFIHHSTLTIDKKIHQS